MNQRILFVNVSCFKNGKQHGDFKYVKETGQAGERYNFESVIRGGNSVCLGYFESGFGKGGYKTGERRRVHIEKIDPVFRNKPEAKDVLVIWHAKDPEMGASIIGWYKDATVFRTTKKRQPNEIRGGGKDGMANGEYLYNVIASKVNCVALPPSEIKDREKWSGCRKNEVGFGFGQSNMWYAKEETPKAKEYISRVLHNIENYAGQNDVT